MFSSLLRQLSARGFRFRKTTFASVYALYERGELAKAQRACAAITDAPAADVAFLRGLIARKKGELDTAAAAMADAVGRRENERAFHFQYAEVLAELGRHEHAITQFDAAVECSGSDATLRESALTAAGRAAAALKNPARAASYFERALALSPENVATGELLGTARYNAGRIDEARAALRTPVRAGKPGVQLRRALMLPEVYQSQAEIDEVRERLSNDLDEILDSAQSRVEDPLRDITLTAFRLAYHNRNNAQLLSKLCRAVRGVYRVESRDLPRRRRNRRLRVGFVSTFFGRHSVGRVTSGLIRDLPRERFCVHVFAVTPFDDGMRAAIERAADHYRALPAVLGEVKRSIEEAELDVLVYADIGMNPLTYFLALSRLAPVQAVWWGHPETTGIDTVDYFLSAAPVEVEHAQAHYTERLVRPPAFFLPAYEKAKLEQPISREALGLPRDTRLYACLQPPFKLHPDMDAVFRGVLERDPRGEVVLLEGTPAAAAAVRRRLARTCGAYAGRIRVVPNMSLQRYLASLAAVDVSLDPLYFGGGNSSADAFSMGVPLVTLPGEHLCGRLTLGLYLEMDIGECVVNGIDEYVEVACRIACTPDLRSAIARDIAAREHVIYDRKDITLAYADFFEQAVVDR